MKRFNWNDDDEEDGFYSDMENEEPDGEDMIDQETLEYLERREAVDLMQLGLLQSGLNQKLLNKTIKMLEKSWFWRFRSQQNKLNLINETYKKLNYIITVKPQEDE